VRLGQLEIVQAVVQGVAVGVLYRGHGPLAMAQEPGNVVCVQQPPGNPDLETTVAVQRSGRITGTDTVARPATPKNLAGVFVIAQEVVDGGKIVSAHGVVPF
jgi:hypothetical protein